MQIEKTPALRRYIRVMRILSAVYFLMALSTFFLNEQIVYILNLLPSLAGVMESLPNSGYNFWLAPASAFLMTLSLMSLISSMRPMERGYALIHLFAKILIILSFFYLFHFHERYFAYLFGIAIESLFTLCIVFVLLGVLIRPETPVSAPEAE